MGSYVKAYLKGLGLWLWIESERELPVLRKNLTLGQIRARKNIKAPRNLSIISFGSFENSFHKNYDMWKF